MVLGYDTRTSTFSVQSHCEQPRDRTAGIWRHSRGERAYSVKPQAERPNFSVSLPRMPGSVRGVLGDPQDLGCHLSTCKESTRASQSSSLLPHPSSGRR
ncbi:hypothetical protein NP493_60g04007 [Ridgeia piscesae]|uniref:Uncharacterized protein n=1 Tax=Ridgeia piscesae TaxID=27915 RepID=A0AAD9PA84_RIDPI|nr:hypothetical protein NP493_60g04007 [Ridgeia piscesae]